MIQGDPLIRRKIAEVGEQNVAVSIITAGEVYYMAYHSERQQENLRRAKLYLSDIGIYSLNEFISELYGQFKSDLIRHYGPKERQKRRKTKIEDIGVSDNDLWIACTSLHYSLMIVSKDQDFPRMKQLRKFSLESWI